LNKEFLIKLRATLDALISENKALRARIEAVEHTVNDVVVGGLTDAANEWNDNEKYSCFVDDFSEIYTPYAGLAKLLNNGGDDYDFSEILYEGSRDKEDVKAYIEEVINKLKAQKEAIDGISFEKKEEPVVEVTEMSDDDGKSVNDYLAEIDKALSKGE
jgi:hypothetical protein